MLISFIWSSLGSNFSYALGMLVRHVIIDAEIRNLPRCDVRYAATLLCCCAGVSASAPLLVRRVR